VLGEIMSAQARFAGSTNSAIGRHADNIVLVVISMKKTHLEEHLKTNIII
jgi:hypothetical protein